MLHHGKRLAIIHAMACACSFWFASGLLTCLESLLFALVHPPVRSPVAHAVRTTCTSAQALIGGPCPQSDTPQPALNVHLSESCGSLFELPTELTSSKHCSAWRIRLVVYGVTASRVRISYPPPSGFWLLSKPFCYPHPHAYTQRSKYVHNRAHSLFLQWRGMAHIPRRPNSHNFRATTAHKNTKMRLRGTSECHMSAK